MTSVAESLRWSSGFRLIWMRPLLSVVLVPSAPMNEEMLSTAGSVSRTFASSCCFSVMASKEVEAEACEMPWMMPVSWVGKKPLGMVMYRTTVSTRVASATSSVMVWKRSTNFRVRP